MWAAVRNGKIEPLEVEALPEGARLLVTILPDDEVEFWERVSQRSVAEVWDNLEDDVYAELLQK